MNEMEIKEITGKPKFSEIIELINAEWPPEFGEKSDKEKIEGMDKSHNLKTDTTKYLYEGEQIIGFYRYSLWPRENPTTNSAHTFDIAILPSFQKKGLGKLLMKDMIADCRKKEIVELLSRSFFTNKGSIKLHLSCGFRKHLETEDSIVWEINPQGTISS